MKTTPAKSPRKQTKLCTACNASPATEPAHRLSRTPRYCRPCVEVMREDAEDAMREARWDERYEYGRPEYDEDPS